ncbi:MAG TPA: ATP-binding protein [Bryobacteraceae bacterium]|nr:ATP-binding protein [Bryobacteraceae bacterium]
MNSASCEAGTAARILSALFESVPMAVLALGIDGRVTLWTAAAERVLGWSEEETLRRPPPFIGEENPDDGVLLLDQCLNGDRLAGVERRWRKKDGSPIEVRIWTAPIRSADGRIEAILATIADVTLQKQLEEQLHHARKMEATGRLAGEVAHDFNNLLMVINGYSDLLRLDLSPGHPGRLYANTIAEAGRKASELTGQLLSLSRRNRQRNEVLSPLRILRDTEDVLQRLAGPDVQLTMHLAPQTGNVVGDAGQLQQVLLNLVLNARDAMPLGGSLRIETENVNPDRPRRSPSPELPHGPVVRISVSDTGVGMTAATRARLFEPFFTSRQVGHGTGLGLYCVSSIVRRMGGRVEVESEPGEGSCFRILLPRVFGEASPDERDDPRFRRELCGCETVLLVEDHPNVRSLIRDTLIQHGYSVLDAHDAENALTVAESHRGDIDLLLTDVIMPGMNGTNLARRVRRTRPEIRVLYMSGCRGAAEPGPGAPVSAAGYIQKPFSAESLLETVRRALEAPAPLMMLQ